ncbi:LysR substrate-binding domain-containing protein [Solilutibacter tolerans]|uniref:Transcriptional regulator, LysR family n=1 Tax=Solilutibacter tolerans TaxID=1604334 RepID=A0A1N6RSD2_9GAMM|nr:LysR substrate-binding domain-containing protein [Lysobacter tolerans]SIQ31632.1 transcriptional regulator, LysR family [Lysobacter tolerans]
MTLTQLRDFVAIVDAGLNITLAAERVHATQPGLSKQLKQLEQRLGFQLFIRKGRSLESLTEEGEQILVHARRALAEVANIRTHAANQRADSTGRLVIATTHTQARYVLPAAVKVIKRRYPNVSVHLEPTADEQLIGQLREGKADLAIISTSGAEPGDGIAIPLFRWRRQVLVPMSHPAAESGVPNLKSLSEWPLLTYESANFPESSLRRTFEAAGLAPQLAMTARDADLIKTYVRAGLGMGVVAEMAVSPVDDADLRVWPAPAELPECVTWAVVPRGGVLRDYTRSLLLELAPQLDRHDLRRVIDGVQTPAWPNTPSWAELSQTISV